MTGVRNCIAERLGYEAKRKGLNARLIAERAHLSEAVVRGYSSARREISFAELTPLCAALALAPMHLLGKHFDKSRLAFRKVSALDLAAVGRIEEAFLLIKEHLPAPRQPSVKAPHLSLPDPGFLLGTLVPEVDELHAHHPGVADLLRWLDLPLLPVLAGADAFDACLLSCDPHFAICINRDKPPARIHFSLLHEIAHYLFDRREEVPLDTNVFDFYTTSISQENRREYVANKFAQNYLVPFKQAEVYARRSPQQWTSLCEDLARWRTSADVLAHALYDQAILRGQRPTLSGIREELAPWEQSCPRPNLRDIRQLLDEHTAILAGLLERHAAEYSCEVLSEIKEALSIA